MSLPIIAGIVWLVITAPRQRTISPHKTRLSPLMGTFPQGMCVCVSCTRGYKASDVAIRTKAAPRWPFGA